MRKYIKSPVTVFILLIVVFLSIGYYKNYGTIVNGIETIGEVTKLEGSGRTQSIEYKYVVNGKTYHAKSSIKYSGCQNNSCIGFQCNVLYNKKNPQESRVTGIIHE